MVLTKIGHHRADLAHFGKGNLPKLPLLMVKLVNLCHSYMFILILMLQALHLIHVEVAVVGHFDRCHHSLQRNVTIRSRQIFARRVRYSYSPWIDYIENNYVHVIYSHLLLLLLLKRKYVVKILIMMSRVLSTWTYCNSWWYCKYICSYGFLCWYQHMLLKWSYMYNIHTAFWIRWIWLCKLQ